MNAPACPRYASLDLWRGVACLMVLLNHATFIRPDSALFADLSPSGQIWTQIAARLWAGVPIFFVISGYCIAATADAQRRRATPVTEYFLRRCRRIFPPYWILLFMAIALLAGADIIWESSLSSQGDFLRPWWFSPSQWIGNLTLTETWRYHAFGTSKAVMLGHAWTLCYEEQFYLVVGLALIATPSHLFRTLLMVTAAVVLAGVGASYWSWHIDGFFFDGSWVLFALGLMVYYTLNYQRASARYWAAALALLVAVYAGRQPLQLLALAKNGSQELFVAAVFAMLLLLVKPVERRVSEARLARPLMICGQMCYSLYLVHLPITLTLVAILRGTGAPAVLWNPLFTVPVGGIASLGVAWLFHLFVERRFMNAPGPSAGRSRVRVADASAVAMPSP